MLTPSLFQVGRSPNGVHEDKRSQHNDGQDARTGIGANMVEQQKSATKKSRWR
jgi:hypothetical protein